MLYRSKDKTLPDFSKGGLGGEIYFDVCTELMIQRRGQDEGHVFFSLTYSPAMELQPSVHLRFPTQASTMHMASRCRQVSFLLSCTNHHRRTNAHQGSDFCTIYVRRTSDPLAPGGDVDHHSKRFSEGIRFVKFSGITWTHDSKGFFYQVTIIPRSNVMTLRCH